MISRENITALRDFTIEYLAALESGREFRLEIYCEPTDNWIPQDYADIDSMEISTKRRIVFEPRKWWIVKHKHFPIPGVHDTRESAEQFVRAQGYDLDEYEIIPVWDVPPETGDES